MAEATLTPSRIPGDRDGRMTLHHRCSGVRPIVCDISSRTTGMVRIAAAAVSNTGQETINATTTTPLIWLGPSSNTATDTAAAPGTAARNVIDGLSTRSTRGDAPIATPAMQPMATANTNPERICQKGQRDSRFQ